MQVLALDAESRWKSLIELYSHTHREILRYRDMEWKILNWTVLLLAGVIGASHMMPASAHLRIVLTVLMTLFTGVVACYGTWHIHFIHRQLTWNRNLRQKIEEIFPFHRPKIYGPESVLNKKWEGRIVPYTSGLSHLISWWLLIWLIATFAMFSICQAGTG